MVAMTECSACGAELSPHETRCPVCSKPTPHYHRQRYCLHCGALAAEKAKTCMMCGQPVDSLPLNKSIFGGSWVGIGIGVLIIVGLVTWVYSYQEPPESAAQVAQNPQATPTLTPILTSTPTSTGTPLATATLTVTVTPTPYVHVIESGETLLYIANLYGVDLDAILALNGLSRDQTLRVGQKLLIPPQARSVPEDDRMPPQIVYVIESGDTLLDIALQHGTTIEGISAANPDVNLDLIFPGQEIVVPLATPTPTSTPTATLTPSPTPGPLHPSPQLLLPAEGQVVDASPVLFNWTATSLLAVDEYYVLQLTWPDGSHTEHWTKASSWQLSREERPTNGLVTWTVSIMRQTGLDENKQPLGTDLTTPGEQRTFEWR